MVLRSIDGQNHWELTDAAFADEMRSRVARGGNIFEANDIQFRDYMHGFAKGFKPAKDFRMAVANEHALSVIESMPAPNTPDEWRTAAAEVSAKVSDRINNTPEVAYDSYILSTKWDQWNANLLRNGHDPEGLKPSWKKDDSTPTKESTKSKPKKGPTGGSTTGKATRSKKKTTPKTTDDRMQFSQFDESKHVRDELDRMQFSQFDESKHVP